MTSSGQTSKHGLPARAETASATAQGTRLFVEAVLGRCRTSVSGRAVLERCGGLAERSPPPPAWGAAPAASVNWLNSPHARMSILGFQIEFVDSQKTTRAITPTVDDKPFTEIVEAFEAAHSFQPVGGYGGLIPEYFNFGPLDEYFLGIHNEESYWASLGGIYLLGCDCGEVGCWPLRCVVVTAESTVLWHRFNQSHRPERDYSLFGPFVFEKIQYQAALAVLKAELSNFTGE